MYTRISIQKRQFLDINSAVFINVDRFFRESKAMLFVMNKSTVIGIISFGDYWKAYNSGISQYSTLENIVNYNFAFLYEDQLKLAESVLNNMKITEIPILDNNNIPLFTIKKSKYCDGQSFYCRCLSGQAKYNFSINADLSVSCHCLMREMGELGNLRGGVTLDEIFHSRCANDIRDNLNKGILPTEWCLRCSDLIAAPKSLCEYYKSHYSFPKVIMIENTSVCNLRCKNCYNALIKKDVISVEDFENIVRQLSQKNIERICLFKYGETFADKDIAYKVDIIRKFLPNVNIVVSTNGMLLDKKESIEAALKMNHLTISLDGTDDEMVAKFQNGSNFSKVYENIKNLIKIRQSNNQSIPICEWKVVMFKWNDSDEMIETAFKKAVEIGIDELHFVAGWNVKEEERTSALFESKALVKFMNYYKFTYIPSHGGRFTFHLNAVTERTCI